MRSTRRAGEIIIRGPFDQAAQRRGDRRDVDQAGERAQAVVADLLGLEPLGLPRHADQLARAERRDDDRARLDRHAGGHAIVERAERGVEGDDRRGTSR